MTHRCSMRFELAFIFRFLEQLFCWGQQEKKLQCTNNPSLLTFTLVLMKNTGRDLFFPVLPLPSLRCIKSKVRTEEQSCAKVFVPTRLVEVERDKLQVAVIWLDQTGDVFKQRRARCKQSSTSDTKLCIWVDTYILWIYCQDTGNTWKHIGKKYCILGPLCKTNSFPSFTDCVCDAADETNNAMTPPVYSLLSVFYL